MISNARLLSGLCGCDTFLLTWLLMLIGDTWRCCFNIITTTVWVNIITVDTIRLQSFAGLLADTCHLSLFAAAISNLKVLPMLLLSTVFDCCCFICCCLCRRLVGIAVVFLLQCCSIAVAVTYFHVTLNIFV